MVLEVLLEVLEVVLDVPGVVLGAWGPWGQHFILKNGPGMRGL